MNPLELVNTDWRTNTNADARVNTHAGVTTYADVRAHAVKPLTVADADVLADAAGDSRIRATADVDAYDAGDGVTE